MVYGEKQAAHTAVPPSPLSTVTERAVVAAVPSTTRLTTMAVSVRDR